MSRPTVDLWLSRFAAEGVSGLLWRLRRPYYPAARPDRFIRDALAPGVDPAEGHRACARYVVEERIALAIAPVLLIGASADPFAMPQLATLRDRLANARSIDVRVIEGGMIPLMEQAPAEVAEVVTNSSAPSKSNGNRPQRRGFTNSQHWPAGRAEPVTPAAAHQRDGCYVSYAQVFSRQLALAAAVADGPVAATVGGAT